MIEDKSSIKVIKINITDFRYLNCLIAAEQYFLVQPMMAVFQWKHNKYCKLFIKKFGFPFPAVANMCTNLLFLIKTTINNFNFRWLPTKALFKLMSLGYPKRSNLHLFTSMDRGQQYQGQLKALTERRGAELTLMDVKNLSSHEMQ